METIPNEKLDTFLAACRAVHGHGLQQCSSGNLSLRLGEDRMLISASGSWLGSITPQQVSLCSLAGAECINGVRPSVESVFHAGILARREAVNVVLHFQSPAATTMACMDTRKVDFFVLPEMAYYIGPVAAVPYITPGTGELAEAVIEAMSDHDMAILRNHGLVTVGASWEEAVQRACFFELICDVILRSNGRADRLSPQAIDALRPGQAKGV
jgi:ribulose-5-phosphate 4-epimerase/fuculose-1-phosphate aldolase